MPTRKVTPLKLRCDRKSLQKRKKKGLEILSKARPGRQAEAVDSGNMHGWPRLHKKKTSGDPEAN